MTSSDLVDEVNDLVYNIGGKPANLYMKTYSRRSKVFDQYFYGKVLNIYLSPWIRRGLRAKLARNRYGFYFDFDFDSILKA
jgi:hypothetical protein